MREIYKISGLTDDQRKYLCASFDVGKTVIDYSEREVAAALREMGMK